MKFKYYILVVLLSLLTGAVSLTDAQSKYGALVVSAVEAYNAHDLAKAETILKKVLTLDPKNDAALYYMAMCHIAHSRADEAEVYLEAAAAADSTNFWYRQRLASLYAVTSRPELAIDMYEKLLADFPKKNELYSDLVELYVSQGELEKALKTLTEVENVFGMTETVAVYRYNLLLRLGKQEEALASLKEYNGRYSSPYVLAILAEHEISMYNDSTALVYYDEALELAPDFSPALLGKAETLRIARKYDEYFNVLSSYVANPMESPKSKSDYISAVMKGMDPKFVRAFSSQMDTVMVTIMKTHPSDSTVLNLAGLYHYSLGRQQQAEECFRQNAEAHPASLSAAAGYVEFLMYVGSWEALSVEGRKAYERFPDELGFIEMASVGDYNLNDFGKVLEACDEVLKMAPADSSGTLRAWSTKGDVYHRLGESAKAYKAYEKALKINPDYIYVLNNYAYYLSVDGKKLKKALEMSRKTIEAQPDNATYLDTYGWILHLLGKDEEAKTHFKRAMLYGGKDSAVIMDHYAEVLFALGEYDKAMVYWNKALMNKGDRIPDLEERINQRKQQMNAKK